MIRSAFAESAVGTVQREDGWMGGREWEMEPRPGLS